MNNIKAWRNTLEQQKGKKIQLTQDIAKNRTEISEKSKLLELYEQAREIIRTVGLQTQQQLQYHISDITSLALEAVFHEPYTLTVEFVQRRNKTECDLFFARYGDRFDPLSATGGGAVDVASFALRIASWSMARPRSRNVIVLDEPLRFLSANYQEKASQMIKELSSKLGLQFIIVTHEPILANYADRTFEVSIKNGKSNIKQL